MQKSGLQEKNPDFKKQNKTDSQISNQFTALAISAENLLRLTFNFTKIPHQKFRKKCQTEETILLSSFDLQEKLGRLLVSNLPFLTLN